ncbi:ABC transporter permease [Poriferisphaera sp. WC338]|uniref:ABC transporter permease n=1 Tax=Poriferisphaera sp. WC338 TaxID=3425129 RepID=UPI003D81B4BE
MNENAIQSNQSLSPPASHFILSTCTLWKREMVRFLRAKNRVVGALAFPVLIWIMLGFGINNMFKTTGAVVSYGNDSAPQAIGYLEYFFPGMLVMILLFTAIFSVISVIEDRREGFLQGVLVSPASRLAIALGKILGGASLAVGQALILTVLIYPLVGSIPSPLAIIGVALSTIIIAISLTALGLCLAWPMDSTAAFHAIMNIFLMPMWFLCGAIFPVASAPLPMRIIMYANPLTYGYTTISSLLIGTDAQQIPLPLAATIMTVFCIVLVLLAARIASKPRKDGI